VVVISGNTVVGFISTMKHPNDNWSRTKIILKVYRPQHGNTIE
jgi:hypothetical protein